MLSINVKRLLFYMLPPVKRYLSTGSLMLRVRWWQYLCNPLVLAMRSYDLRRKYDVLKANVTTELVVFQNYLRKVTGDDALLIAPPGESGIYVSLSSAIAQTNIYIGNSDGSPSGGLFINMQHSQGWVLIYQTADPQLIKKELDNYLLLGLTCNVQASV